MKIKILTSGVRQCGAGKKMITDACEVPIDHDSDQGAGSALKTW